MTDNPTSSEGKKIVQKFVFQKSSRQAAYLPSLFSTYSQLSKERKNNFQSNFSRGFYLVPKCIEKKITVAQTLEGDLGQQGIWLQYFNSFCEAIDMYHLFKTSRQPALLPLFVSLRWGCLATLNS